MRAHPINYVFVFYFINNLCSVELVNKNINIFIKVTENTCVCFELSGRVDITYRLDVYGCLRVNRVI